MSETRRPAADFSWATVGSEPVLRLQGVLTVWTLGDLLPRLQAAVQERPPVRVDLGGVVQADSAALALLVELARQSVAQGGPAPFFAGLPAKLRDLVRLYHLQDVLSFDAVA
ncbi:STAS domain-containing protein [Thermithiobacillus tepidarius DSM 3134]|uniref:STAS domain-containing protein n=1 Tax=Thermithiobacillus tepidarius TaxID=929 RepID=UPI00041D72B5|nr:STAS domain-containing protein [Thermithiobacillus tepidarius]